MKIRQRIHGALGKNLLGGVARNCVLLAALSVTWGCGEDAPDTALDEISGTLLPALTEDETGLFCDAQQETVSEVLDDELLISIQCAETASELLSETECQTSFDECIAAGGLGPLDDLRAAAQRRVESYGLDMGSTCSEEESVVPATLPACDATVEEAIRCQRAAARQVRAEFEGLSCQPLEPGFVRVRLEDAQESGYYNPPSECLEITDRCFGQDWQTE